MKLFPLTFCEFIEVHKYISAYEILFTDESLEFVFKNSYKRILQNR